jgi:putative tricarboxylic transport membrane protein
MWILNSGIIFLQEPELIFHLLWAYLLGFFFGAVPGLTATLAISLLLPLTFGMKPITALIACIGIYVGGIYGGGVTGTLINIPGAPAGALTTLEGYKLTLKGQAAKALAHGAFASLIGGVIGAILAMALLWPLAKVSLYFKTPDKFSLIFMALIVTSLLNTGAITKGVISTILGMMLATIGIDYFETIPRFTFGLPALSQGTQLLSVVVGTFAISEVLSQLESSRRGDLKIAKESARHLPTRHFIFTKEDLKQIGLLSYARSALVGFFAGVLPGAGAAMAALISYTLAKSVSKHKEEFGRGSVEGIAAAEAANNAMCPGAVVPMLLFGIPGDAVTAVMLGVFMIHGLIPGPQLLVEQANVVGAILLALLVSPLLIYGTLLLFGRHYVKICSVRKEVLYPFVAVISIIGLYCATYSPFQILLAIFLGFAVYAMKKGGYPSVPFLLGYILGPLLERYFRSAMRISQGDFTIFFKSPFSLAFLAMSFLFIYLLAVRLPKSLRAMEEGVADEELS